MKSSKEAQEILGSEILGSESSARVIWHLTLTPKFLVVDIIDIDLAGDASLDV